MPEDVLDAEQTVAAPPPAPPTAPAPPAAAPYRKTPEQHLYEMADKYHVDPQLALAILTRESGGRQTGPDGQVLQSGQGAQGFFQLLPKTAYGEFQLDPRDPFQNIEAGVRYLRQGMDRGDGTIRSVASYYHGGPNRQLWGPVTGQYAQGIEDDLRQRLAGQPTGPAGSPQPQPDTAQPGAPPSSPDAPPTPPARTIGPHGEWAGYYPLPPPKPIPQGFDEQHPWLAEIGDVAKRVPTPDSASLAEQARRGTSKFFQEATSSLNPVNLWEATKALVMTPPGTVPRALWDANAKLREEGHQLMDQARASHNFGQSLEGLTRIGEGMIPLFGPRLAEADKYVRSGEYARGAGALTDVAGQILGPEAIKDSRVTPKVFKPRLNPNEAAAVRLGQDAGVPIDVATASGSPFALKLQRMTEATAAGSPVAERVQLARGEAMPALADQLASPVHPVPVTTHQAGQALEGGVQSYIQGKDAIADASYDAVRQVEADPVNAQSVQVGTRKDWHPSGDGTLVDVPIVENMPLPADLRPAKAALQPVWDRLMRNPTAATLADASPGLQAIKAVIQGPDFMRASDLDTILSSVKALARGADMPELRTVAQGLSAKVVSTLEDAHANAIANAGPAAVDALRTGRQATIAKHAAEEVLAKLKDEPVLSARGATNPRLDAGIEHLKDLQRLAPQELPKVARAFLEELFSSGTAEGGWKGATGLEARWKRLGPQTKQLLFGSAAPDLDKFFLLGKMLERTPNASGTALTLSGVGSAVAAITNPRTGIPALLAAGQIAKLMNSRFGVRLLTKGLTIPADSAAAIAWAAAVTQQLGKVARREGQIGDPDQVATPPPLPGLAGAPPAPPR